MLTAALSLIAFGLTAVLTFLAIIVGYATRSIPGNMFTAIDEVILDSFAPVKHSKMLSWIYNTSIARSSISQRQQAFENFVLSLSDQQLVTGLAILIAAYANYCTISTFELTVVVSLAWLSSTTHLATLDMLQPYFRRERKVNGVRIVRIIAMLCILGLLLSMDALASAYTVSETTPSCQALNKYFNIQDHPIVIIPTIVTLIYMVKCFAERILHLYQSHGLLNFLARITKSRWQNSLSGNNHALQASEVVDSYIVYKKAQLVSHQRLSSVFAAYRDSLLSRIIDLLFFLCYGLAQLIYRRYHPNVKMPEPTNQMEFGQIVSLILLVLPVLVLVGIISDHETFNAMPVTPTTSEQAFNQGTKTAIETRHKMAVFVFPLLHFCFVAVAGILPNNSSEAASAAEFGIFGIYLIFIFWSKMAQILSFLRFIKSNEFLALHTRPSRSNTENINQAVKMPKEDLEAPPTVVLPSKLQ